MHHADCHQVCEVRLTGSKDSVLIVAQREVELK